jgi:hypothetical protein
MAEKWYETPDVSRNTNSDKCLKPVLIISGNSFAPNYLPSFTWKLNSTGCNWFFVNGLFFTTLKWDNAVTMPGIWDTKPSRYGILQSVHSNFQSSGRG